VLVNNGSKTKPADEKKKTRLFCMLVHFPPCRIHCSEIERERIFFTTRICCVHPSCGKISFVFKKRKWCFVF